MGLVGRGSLNSPQLPLAASGGIAGVGSRAGVKVQPLEVSNWLQITIDTMPCNAASVESREPSVETRRNLSLPRIVLCLDV